MTEIEQLIKVLKEVREATRQAHIATKDARAESKSLRTNVENAKKYEASIGQTIVQTIEGSAEALLDQFADIVNEAVTASEAGLKDRYTQLTDLLIEATNSFRADKPGFMVLPTGQASTSMKTHNYPRAGHKHQNEVWYSS